VNNTIIKDVNEKIMSTKTPLHRLNYILILLGFSFSLSAQRPKDSIVIVLDTIKIPIDFNRNVPSVPVKWVYKTETIKNEKYKDSKGDKPNIVYFYIKNKYIKRAKKELKIK
jgi:hypothetical protein